MRGGDKGAGLGTFFQERCSCVSLWSKVTVIWILLLPAWMLWPNLVSLAPSWSRCHHPSCSTFGVAFHGGAASARCQPCPIPSQWAERELGSTTMGKGMCEGAGGTAMGTGVWEGGGIQVRVKPPPCLSADPESQRKRTVQNVLDLRQNLEETMSSLRGSQVSHR